MRPGDEVSIDGKPFKIAGMDKWSGLMRNPQGVPMAAVVLTGDAAAAPTAILLASDIWRLTPGGAAVCFKWHPSEAEARQAAAAPPPGLESARWGVIDRGAVNWFGSFTPGAGAVLSSGEEVALVSFDEKKTAVAVEIKQGTEKRAVWVRANEVVDGIPVRFEYPGLAKYVFILHAWEDGKAIVAEYGNGQPVAQKELLQRHWLYRESSEVNLRLDDVFSAAVAVTESESTLWAAVLKAESGDEIVLREGEARRFGDSLVEYGRLTQRPAPTCTLTIGGDRQVVLKPMESVRVGDWSLRLSVPWDDFETAALLDADYMPGRRWALLLGAIGVTVLLSRFAARASRRIEPPIARDEASQ
jgi:hypothetical protein